MDEPPAGWVVGATTAGAAVTATVGEGSVVAVGVDVAARTASVARGFNVAAGTGVRVGLRVGGTGVAVGAAVHPAMTANPNITSTRYRARVIQISL